MANRVVDTASLGDRTNTTLLIAIATLALIYHVLTGGNYGFHRDELATLDDAHHLAWGFVAYPPVTPFFARLALELFGTSLTGFRFFAASAGALSILLTGLMARNLGGRRGAQLFAACTAAPFALTAGSLMQYVAFDYLSWVASAYFVIRLCQSRDPRWWLALGVTIGFGMLSKYSMLVCAAGIVVGVFASDLRAHLRGKWLWVGAALSLLIFLPNLIWQIHHHFISLDFLRHIHGRDVRIGRTKDFLPDQLELTLFGLPLAIAGFCFYFFAPSGRRFRALGWMFLVPFTIFLFAKGRGYYLAGVYPMLYAGGAVWGEEFLGRLRRSWSLALRGLAWAAILFDIVFTAAFFTPIAPIHSRWWDAAMKLNGDFREEIGWPELVETVAQIRASLPPGERDRAGVLATNYGEAGSIDLYGPRYGLPPAISGVNSYWERGYGDPPPEVLIVLGASRGSLEREFESVELAGQLTNRDGVLNEETKDNSEVFVCRRLRTSWPEFWQRFRHFG